MLLVRAKCMKPAKILHGLLSNTNIRIGQFVKNHKMVPFICLLNLFNEYNGEKLSHTCGHKNCSQKPKLGN